MNNFPNNIISFAEFELDTVRRKLVRDGETIALHAKAFDLLTFLAQNNGRLVSKEEILDAVWQGSFVEESNLVVQISNLRKALGETKNSPRFLLTIPGKGYKFVTDIDEDAFFIETHSIAELTIEEIKPENLVLPGEQKSNLSRLATFGFLFLIIVGIGWFWLNYRQPPPNKTLKLAKLTTSGKIANIALSPDGRFAVFAQKEDNGESLWLRQLETGSEQRIVEPQSLNYVGLTISPDNQFIFAAKFLMIAADPILEKIPLLGGPAQRIPNIASGAAVSISPDGKRFAFVESFGNQNETFLGVSDIEGANPQFLKRVKSEVREFPAFYSSPLAWSPIGDEIAAAVYEKKDKDSNSAVLLINPKSGEERYLTDKRWKDIDNLAWLDADNLAFLATTDDGLPSQVWTISRQTGEAKQITNGLQNYDWLGASGDKILTVQNNSFSRLMIADFEKPENPVNPREIFSASDYISEMDWTKSGEIIYASQVGGIKEIWKMNSDGSQSKQLTKNAKIDYGLSVSPLDDSIIFASKQNGIRGIWQVDANGKNMVRMSEGKNKSPNISQNGKIVFQTGLSHSEGVFLIAEGETRKISDKGIFPAISPDGTLTAYFFMDWKANGKWRIALISNETGEMIRQFDLPIPIYERRMSWHPSGKYITQIFSEGEQLKMILYPVDGGKPQIVSGLGKGESSRIKWSPDGKQILYPQITTAQDAVLLTDF